MEVVNDIYKFLKILSIVDIIFLVAIFVLLILVIILVYFIKINKDDVMDNYLESKIENEKDYYINEIKEDNNDEVVVPKEEEKEELVTIYDDEEAPLLDLNSLTKKLQEQQDNESVKCSEYEKDQEQKAIISYDELLKKHNKYAINYEKEEIIDDDVIVKKVNLNNLVNTECIDNYENVRAISYEKEEAFLNALKELNSLLN